MSSPVRLLPALLALLLALSPARSLAQEGGAGPFAQVAVGDGFSCALAGDGRAFCWGTNDLGQLGASRIQAPQLCPVFPTSHLRACSPGPNPVEGGPRFTALVAGIAHACGLSPEGAAFCWGSDVMHQLGTETGVGRCRVETSRPQSAVIRAHYVGCSHVPLPVDGGHRFRQISASEVTTCGVTAEGRALCWGAGSPRPAPPRIAGGGERRYVSVSAGDGGACGLTEAGEALCWRADGAGEPGPVPVPAPLVALSGGAEHACGLDRDGAAWCWGGNAWAQGGSGATTGLDERAAPARVAGGHRFRSLHASQGGTCALDLDGAAWCWGRTDGVAPAPDACPINTSEIPCARRPVRAPASGLRSLAVSLRFRSHACGVTLRGAAVCWGGNVTGALGDGTVEPRSSPVPVAAP